MLIALLALIGCANSEHPYVRLEERSDDIPPVQQVHNASSTSTLKIAVAGVLSPSENLKTYQQLLTHLGDQLCKGVSMIQKPTYAEVNALLKAQSIDLAFVCSLAYVEGNEDFGMELLVAPQMGGQTVYYSYLIVPEDSDVESLESLQGKVFAFTDPLSNSGRLAPMYQLFLMGGTPDSFFSEYVFTYSHDNSIKAVTDGLVDGAAVDSLVYDHMAMDNPELRSKTKIIARWGPYGIPPVVVHPDLDSHLKEQLRDALLNLGVSAEGRNILDDLRIDYFTLVDDNIFDSIRQMMVKLGL
jgi:phosphonate transport system substrate-binding protein